MQPQPWIKARVKELGKTLKGLGTAMGGLDAARITEIMAGTRRVQPPEVEALAVYLELPRETVHARFYGVVPLISGDVRSPSSAAQSQSAGLRVLNATDIGGGIVTLSKESVDTAVITTQPVLGAFSCYVVTDHMIPAYRRNDRIVVNPVQPADIGDDVLLLTDDDQRNATLRHLVGITDSHWVVKQWNPEKVDKLDRKIWRSAMRVESVHRG